jgi:hypothetical protein
MAFQYGFKLNGEPLLATLGVTTIDKLEEPLDEGAMHIPITVRDIEYKMFGLLEIEVEDGVNEPLKFDYLIMSDEVSVISKDGLYSHNLMAIEYTHKLDKYFISTLTFTKPFLSKRRAPFTYLKSTPPIQIWAFLPKIEINERYFNNTNYTIPQVPKAKYFTGDQDDLERDVYIKVGSQSRYNLTNASFNLNVANTGFIDIEIGVLDGSSHDAIYTYHVEIVSEIRYTLYDVIQRVQAVAPIESKFYHEQTRLFDLDENLENRFKQIEMPQLFIQKQSVRQTLNTIFKYINAISRLRHVEDGRDTLTIDEFNAITGQFNFQDVLDYNSQQDIQQYATKAISFLENSLQSNFRETSSIKTPAEGRFKTVRSSGIQLTDTDFNLPLEYSLYELSKFEIVIPKVMFRAILDLGGSSTVSATDIDDDVILDLTPRIIEKQWWELKDLTVNFPDYTPKTPFSNEIGLRKNRGGHLYWERNTKKIDLSYAIGEFFKQQALIPVIQEALNEEITLYPKEIYSGSFLYFLRQDASFYSGSGVDLSPYTISNIFRNIKFNVEYITYDNPVMQVDRSDVMSIDYESTVRINQQAKFTDYGRASRDAYGQLQRGGVPNISFSRVHTSLDGLYPVGTIDQDGYIITKRSLTYFNEHLIAKYEATLDHNRLNEFLGIDQEYRVFEIPTDNVFERNDFFAEYLVVVEPNNQLTESSTMINATGRDLAMKRLYNNDGLPSEITYAFVRTDGFLERYPDDTDDFKAIMTPVNTFGGKGAVVFKFGFKSNQVAGNALYEDGGSPKRIYNEPVRYTDGLGFFKEIWFGLGSVYSETSNFPTVFSGEDTFNKEYKYPLIKHTDATLGQEFHIVSGSANPDDIAYNPIIAYKDASSNYYVSFIVPIIPLSYKNYVLGQNFYTDNRLVKNPDVDVEGNDVSSKLYLFKYTTPTVYNKFDDLLLKDGYSSVVELKDGINTEYVNGVLTFKDDAFINEFVHKAWAIADEDGNLYVACNKPINGLRIVRRHFRPNMKYIGNKNVDPEPINFLGSAYNEAQMTFSIVSFLPQNNTIDFNHEVVIISPDNIDLFVEGYIENTLNFNAMYMVSSNEVAFQHQVTFDVPDNMDLFITAFNQNVLNFPVTYMISSRQVTFTHVITEDLKYIDYQWQSGGTTPTVGQSCSISAHAGNIRCDATPVSCTWQEIDAYFASQDESDNIGGSCFIPNSTKTECVFFMGQWACTVYLANITYSYSNCETCVPVEVAI